MKLYKECFKIHSRRYVYYSESQIQSHTFENPLDYDLKQNWFLTGSAVFICEELKSYITTQLSYLSEIKSRVENLP